MVVYYSFVLFVLCSPWTLIVALIGSVAFVSLSLGVLKLTPASSISVDWCLFFALFAIMSMDVIIFSSIVPSSGISGKGVNDMDALGGFGE